MDNGQEHGERKQKSARTSKIYIFSIGKETNFFMFMYLSFKLFFSFRSRYFYRDVYLVNFEMKTKAKINIQTRKNIRAQIMGTIRKDKNRR